MIWLKLYFANPKIFRALFKDIFWRHTYYFVAERPDPFIIDAGANIGMASRYFKWLYPEANILAIEPITTEILSLNTDIQILEAALSNEKEVTMYCPKSITGNTTIPNGKYKNFKEVKVKGIKLSDIIFGAVDLLKLDIEGAEGEVIQDLVDTGKIKFIEQMILEYHYNKTIKKNQLDTLLHNLKISGFDYIIYRSEKEKVKDLQKLKNKNHYHFIIWAYRNIY